MQTASSEHSASITAAQTEELPVYGRTITSLVAIAPGVVDPVGATARTLTGTDATDFNVAGNRTTANNFSVDGITLTAVGGAPNGTFVPAMEAISEIRVLQSNYQAEYGRLAGSDIQMVTKSGTLQYHGMAMYYGRNEDLNADNFFNNVSGIPRPVNRLNAVTYNIGGPVWAPSKLSTLRHKVFFFWNQEFLPQTVTGALQYSTMPTTAQKAGNLSGSINGDRSDDRRGVSGKHDTDQPPRSQRPRAHARVPPAERVEFDGLQLRESEFDETAGATRHHETRLQCPAFRHLFSHARRRLANGHGCERRRCHDDYFSAW